jgi:hypothetical protein
MSLVHFGSDCTAEDIKRFVLGGHAVFTLQSEKTGAHYTYRVSAPADHSDRGNPAWKRAGIRFVSVLAEGGKYIYMGIVGRDGLKFRFTTKSKFAADAPSVKAFDFFLGALRHGVIPSQLSVFHSNRCGCCGRELTDPESVRLGIGPVCRGGK